MEGLGLLMSRLYLKFRLQKFRPPTQGYTIKGFKPGVPTLHDFHLLMLYCVIKMQNQSYKEGVLKKRVVDNTYKVWRLLSAKE